MAGMLGRLAKQRKRYYTMINTYKIRRVELRSKYPKVDGENGRKVFPDDYKKRLKPIQRKIDIWSIEIKRLDILYDKLRSLERAIVGFSGIAIKNKTGRTSDEIRLIKSIYYKYGLENGIPAYRLREYIGIKLVDQPAMYRTKFTYSFKSKPENKQMWLNFKRFYKSKHIVRKRKNNTTYAA